MEKNSAAGKEFETQKSDMLFFFFFFSSSSSFSLFAAIIMPVSSSSSKTKRASLSQSSSSNSLLLCKHSPSATLDLLILILVLFSCTFLVTSYLSYIFHSLSLVLPYIAAASRQYPLPYAAGFLIFFTGSIVAAEIYCNHRSRRCENPKCKGLKKAMEFDIQLQTEECLKSSSKEIDDLPWKGGTEGNPDYECLRSELKRLAPPNGRAVLLFRARCGCPVAKLEAWGSKRGRRHKKGNMNILAIDGDH